MKPTEAKKEILKLFEEGKDEEGVSLWYNILSENQSVVVSQHIFNNVIFKIGMNGWNRMGEFSRLYSIAYNMINSGLFTLLNKCKFMTQNKKSLGCLRFMIAAIVTNGDTITFNKFIKELYAGCSYDEFKGVLQDCVFKSENKYVMFNSLQSIKTINDTVLESGLLHQVDKVLFTLITNNFSNAKVRQPVDVMNIIEDFWDNEEIKFEAIESLFQEGFMANNLNIVRILSSDNHILSTIYQKNGLGNDRFNILMFEDRFRKQVFDVIFQHNDDGLIIPVITFIHECYEIKITKGSILKIYPGGTENWYEQFQKCALEDKSGNVDIIEKTISEIFSCKSSNVLKFFLINGIESKVNNRLIGFKYKYNKQIFEQYLKYRVEDLHKFIESQEQYYNYNAKIYPYIDDSYDKKKTVVEETYRYFVSKKDTWMIIELIEGITQNDKTLAKELIIDLICNETDDRFQITSYYNPKRVHDVFGTLNTYFKDASVYKLLGEEFIFKKKAFKNVIDYLECILSIDSDWSVKDLIYEEIFFVTDDLDSVFNLYIKYSEKIYGTTPYFNEIVNISNREEFVGDRKEQILKGFTQVYHHLENINFKYIDNFRESLINYFNIKL